MLTRSQHDRLQNITVAPWKGILNYFPLMRADWDVLEGLGYVTQRLLPFTRSNSTDMWEYTITDAGRAALVVQTDGRHE